MMTRGVAAATMIRKIPFLFSDTDANDARYLCHDNERALNDDPTKRSWYLMVVILMCKLVGMTKDTKGTQACYSQRYQLDLSCSRSRQHSRDGNYHGNDIVRITSRTTALIFHASESLFGDSTSYRAYSCSPAVRSRILSLIFF